MSGNPKRFSRTSLPSMEHSKVPPNAIEFEDAVLGSCLLESEVIDDVSSILSPESFYKIEHQKIFSAIIALHSRSNPVDILTVTQELKSGGHINESLSPYFISKLTERIAGGANAEYHARIIQQKFIARELIRVSGDIYHEAYEDTTDALELLDRANMTFAGIGSDFSSEGRSKSNKELTAEVTEDAERAAAGSMIVGFSSGISDVDRLTGGWEGGKFYILAARPSMGKSSWALQKAYYISVILKQPSVFFSLEMTAKELMLRLISLHTGIDANLIKTGRLDPEQWGRYTASLQAIIESPLEIIDNVFNLMDIRKRVLILKKRKGLKAIFIDYLQLIKHKESGRNREQEISEISRMMKQTAKDVDCPVIGLAQLSRAVETRGGTKRPMLSDLRESGSLEQDADQVHFMYRPEYYGIEVSDETNLPTQGLTELIVAKNRGGSTGIASMRFHKETTSFSPWEAESFTAPPPPPREGITQKWSPMPRSEEFDDDAF